jgi:hypothetical protein
MTKTTRRLLIGYPIFGAGIAAVAMIQQDVDAPRYDIGGFIVACCFGLWIVAAIVFVRK